jgi:uncharacterized damage-inducible protein DinB
MTMATEQKRQLMFGLVECKDALLGRYLWMLQDSRQRTRVAVEGLESDLLGYKRESGGNSIGTLLYHIALIEADWLYVEILEKPYPPEIAALLPDPDRDAAGHLAEPQGQEVDTHMARLDAIRCNLVKVLSGMELHEFLRVRTLDQYAVTPEWVVHHLLQHEAQHRGQIIILKREAVKPS